jgi:hypothetical protein
LLLLAVVVVVVVVAVIRSHFGSSLVPPLLLRLLGRLLVAFPRAALWLNVEGDEGGGRDSSPALYL